MIKTEHKDTKMFRAIGRRKRAIARVKLLPGVGKIKIDNKDKFSDLVLNSVILAPLKLVGLENKFDVETKVSGGGISSRPEAIRLGIARALLKYDSNLRQTLRKAGYLTRDPREKERKKPGLKRARKAPQWQKR